MDETGVIVGEGSGLGFDAAPERLLQLDLRRTGNWTSLEIRCFIRREDQLLGPTGPYSEKPGFSERNV